jgi:hypothetical protein
MTLFRSFLLGTAAVIASSAAAIAADMDALPPLPQAAAPSIAAERNEPPPPPPVCAKNKGYYQAPGTEICMKVTGLIRTFVAAHQDNVADNVWLADPPAVKSSSTHNDPFAIGALARFGVDATTETEYGTLRGNIMVQSKIGAMGDGSVGLRYAFIQWGGWTFGHTDTFFVGGDGALGGFANTVGDYGGNRRPLVGYTANLSKEFKASLSIEDHTTTMGGVGKDGANADAYLVAAPVGVAFHNDGTQMPDLVGNVVGDFDWGNFAVSGALARYRFYDSKSVVAYDDDFIGWAIGGGTTIKLDGLNKGDKWQAKFGYADGATSYIGSSGDAAIIDAVGPDFAVMTTTGWTAQTSFLHNWAPTWNSTLYGGYAGASRTTDADTLTTPNGQIVGAWNAGANLTWQPHETLNIGGDIFYASVTKGDTVAGDQTEGAFGGLFRVEKSL